MTVSCSLTGICHTSGVLTQHDVSRRFDVIVDTSYTIFEIIYLKNGLFQCMRLPLEVFSKAWKDNGSSHNDERHSALDLQSREGKGIFGHRTHL